MARKSSHRRTRRSRRPTSISGGSKGRPDRAAAMLVGLPDDSPVLVRIEWLNDQLVAAECVPAPQSCADEAANDRALDMEVERLRRLVHVIPSKGGFVST